MSISQDSSQEFHEYDSDDRQLLVGLLHEYSEKLIEASREVIRKRGRTSSEDIIILSLALILSFSFSYLFWIVLKIYLIADKFSDSFLKRLYITVLESSDYIASAILLCSTGIVFPLLLAFIRKSNLFTSFYFTRYERLRRIENDLLERDARMIANRLESAMRLTVEVADRVETNLARKLELDLRIDDASSALDYYYSVVNLKSKPQSKSRKVAP
jgi:hypothetical protein